MSDVKSDIQIAREAKMQPINDILAKINVLDEVKLSAQWEDTSQK